MPKAIELSADDLLSILKEIAQTKPEVSHKVAEERYRTLCRNSYTIIRAAFAEDEPERAISAIFHKAVESFGDNDAMGSQSAMLLQMFDEYLQIQALKSTSKEEFIQALDIAVQRVGHHLHEHFDNESSSEQSS